MTERCPHCGQVKKRTSEQNRRLHLLFHEIASSIKGADGLYHPHQWWKAMMKDRWLGYDEYNTSDGRTVYVLRATSDLSVDALNEFMNRVEEWAAKHGVYLQE